MRGVDDSVSGGKYGLAAQVPTLSEEFPVSFSIQQTSNGVSLSAKDRNRAARPGVYAVITDNADEMRRTLREGLQ